MTQAPLACLATAPVSRDRGRPPISNSFLYVIDFLRCRRPLIASSVFVFRGAGRMMGSGRKDDVREARQKSCGRTSVRPRGFRLFADAELLDHGAVAVEIGLLEVVEQAAAPADELEQAAARVVVLRVRLEVLGQVVDAVRE